MSVETNKEIVKKVNEASMSADVEGFLSYFSDDVRWTMIGMPTWEGKEAVREAMQHDDSPTPPEFTVDHIVAEGDMVVCDGSIKMTKKDGTVTNGRFCDIYQMKNGKIAELNTYMVEFK